jgi:DNA-binding XRE family transcriptional regulator
LSVQGISSDRKEGHVNTEVEKYSSRSRWKTFSFASGRPVLTLRDQLGVSQQDFAEQAGIHRTCVSSIELAKGNVGIEVAKQLAVALGKWLSYVVRKPE